MTATGDSQEDTVTYPDPNNACSVAAAEPATESEPPIVVTAHRSKGKLLTDWRRALVYTVIPAAVLLSGAGAGYLKWTAGSAHEAQVARIEALNAAKDGAVAMLSYTPDTVAANLTAAQAHLTGAFKDSYASLVQDTVIPGSQQQRIISDARIGAAAPVSATADHAVILVFVDQTTTIGAGAPTDTASSVRIALDKVDGRWLISAFDPI